MLDLDFVRTQFPALQTPWALMDNAGGSVPCRQVIDRVRDYMERLPVQLGASYGLSVEAGETVAVGRQAAADLVGAELDEIVLGASTTVLVQQLATALRASWKEGDEIVVTNLEHEANVGPWAKLAATGIVVREWCVRPDTFTLHLEDLEPLLSDRTRLVTFTHCSNITGTITDAAAIAKRIRAAGALSCADGVAYAPHRHIDVKTLDVDFYLLSLYKVYGPHFALMYGKREHLLESQSPHHFFIPTDSVPGKFEPGNPNFELAASLVGILDYLRALGSHHGLGESPDLSACFSLMAAHEEEVVSPLLAYLDAHPRVRLIGSSLPDSAVRVPTVAFTVHGRQSSEITAILDRDQLATRFGHFYAYRLIRDLGLLDQDGVVRVSLAHYNSPAEVTRLLAALEQLL